MATDRHERRHRRTASNDACVKMMADANFDAVPSLAEAMGLEEPVMTHAGYRRRDIHENVYGSRPCRSHALSLSQEPTDHGAYRTICGELIHFTRCNEWGEPLPNIRAALDTKAGPVTCKRCRRLLGKQAATGLEYPFRQAVD